jgi:hypothetical protein
MKLVTVTLILAIVSGCGSNGGSGGGSDGQSETPAAANPANPTAPTNPTSPQGTVEGDFAFAYKVDVSLPSAPASLTDAVGVAVVEKQLATSGFGLTADKKLDLKKLTQDGKLADVFSKASESEVKHAVAGKDRLLATFKVPMQLPSAKRKAEIDAEYNDRWETWVGKKPCLAEAAKPASARDAKLLANCVSFFNQTMQEHKQKAEQATAPCYAVYVDAESTEATCLDEPTTSETAGGNFYLSSNEEGAPLQFDDAGNLYYVQPAKEGVKLLKRPKARGASVAVLAAKNISRWRVSADGSVVVSAQVTDTQKILRIAADGELRQVSSAVQYNVYADGAIYYQELGADKIMRYDAATGTKTEWLDVSNLVYNYERHRAVSVNGETFVKSTFVDQRKVYRVFPNPIPEALDLPVTPDSIIAIGDKLAVNGADAEGKFSLHVVNPETGASTKVSDGLFDQLSASGDVLYFSNATTVGSVSADDLSTVSMTPVAGLKSFQPIK